ncbi:hypothetical protein SK128_006242 [Halocaridina rubra]|uniref:Uncharacterized protein n=1 Tax=Halocaridina rubra TaxID=373956 RepID=A0AAN8XRV0_HALRR
METCCVHIATDVDPKVLQKMPVTNEVKRECGTLWLSYITDSRIEWACRVARDLLPDDCKTVYCCPCLAFCVEGSSVIPKEHTIFQPHLVRWPEKFFCHLVMPEREGTMAVVSYSNQSVCIISTLGNGRPIINPATPRVLT